MVWFRNILILIHNSQRGRPRSSCLFVRVSKMASILTNLTCSNDPKTMVRDWQRKIREEQRRLDRQMAEIAREEAKVRLEMKTLAKKDANLYGTTIRSLAKEVVHAQRATSRMYTAKAQLNSLSMQMRTQFAQMQMAETFKVSTDLMKTLNSLITADATGEMMRELAREMEKAGMMQEMMDEAIDDATNAEADDSLADAEVEKIISEVTMSKLNGAPLMLNKAVPVPAQQRGREVVEEEEEEEGEDDEADRELGKRLSALQSS